KRTIELCEELYEKYKERSQRENAIKEACEKIFKELNELNENLEHLPNLLTVQIKRVHKELHQFYQYSLLDSSQIIEQQKIEEYTLIKKAITEKTVEFNLSEINEVLLQIHLESTILERKERAQKSSLRDDLLLCAEWL